MHAHTHTQSRMHMPPPPHTHAPTTHLVPFDDVTSHQHAVCGATALTVLLLLLLLVAVVEMCHWTCHGFGHARHRERGGGIQHGAIWEEPVCVCVRACVCLCLHACLRVCIYVVRARVYVFVCMCAHL